MRHLLDAPERHPGLVEVCQQFIRLRFDHQPLADQAVNALRRRLLTRQHNLRRMLEDHRQRDHRLSRAAGQQQAAGAHAIFGPPRKHFAQRIEARLCLAYLDIQPDLAIKAFLQRSVIACELERVRPFELQHHLVGGLRRLSENCHCSQGHGDQEKDSTCQLPSTIWGVRAARLDLTVSCHCRHAQTGTLIFVSPAPAPPECRRQERRRSDTPSSPRKKCRQCRTGSSPPRPR